MKASADVSLDVRVARPGGRHLAAVAEPLTFGVPFPRGVLLDAAALSLVDDAGTRVATEARVLNRWPDGSCRWVLVDTQIDVPHASAVFTLATQASTEVSAPGTSLQVQPEGDAVSVDTGAARFRLAPGSASPIVEAVIADRRAFDAAASGISVDDAGGRCAVAFDRIGVEELNRLRAVVLAEGTVRSSNGQPIAALIVRLHFFAGSPVVRMLICIRNPRRAEHQGGFWDLGDNGSIYLKDASLTIGLPPSGGAATIHCSPETDWPFDECAAPVRLYQDSSGGKNWKSSNHLNRERKVPHTFRGYRWQSGSATREGLRATPVVRVQRDGLDLSATLVDFWQNFPKAVEASASGIVVRLFPGQFADLHELQGGEQKTHDVFVSFGRDGITKHPLDWSRSRLVASCEPRWYCDSGAIPHLTPGDLAADAPRAALVAAAVEGPDSFAHKREVIDEFGWRHFGEIYGDHEAVRQKDPPLVSHYNNQYDPTAGFAYQFMRTSDLRWWAEMRALADHVVDIDIYHTTEDKSAYNNGLFWHTYHYGDADTCTHRSYPKLAAGRTHGGGPSGEHNYTTGLTLHYFLTGDPTSREAAIALGQFVVDADDGDQTVFRWLARGATGYPSASGSFAYHGPGRGSGNSLNALVDAFELSGERRFLDKAEELIRRCIHPADDVPARQLLDWERKWFYTMFLQALGKYLDLKAERGELDELYAHGRASLLHYARWMAEHESPYLDFPERLEFPTETWAAQDMRKSDIFYQASRHAEGPEKEMFHARGLSYYRYSTTKLASMPTRTLARPVIVLLSSGALHAWCESDARASSAAAPQWSGQFAPPVVFEPQRARATRRAKQLAVLGAASVGAGLLYLAAAFLL